MSMIQKIEIDGKQVMLMLSTLVSSLQKAITRKVFLHKPSAVAVAMAVIHQVQRLALAVVRFKRN